MQIAEKQLVPFPWLKVFYNADFTVSYVQVVAHHSAWPPASSSEKSLQEYGQRVSALLRYRLCGFRDAAALYPSDNDIAMI